MTEVEKFLILVLSWLSSAVAIFITAYLLPGVVLDSFVTALVVAIVLSAINLIIKPVLILLTLPLTILTFGLFVLFINAFLVWLASIIVPGFIIGNLWWALLFGLVLSVVNAVFYQMSQKRG